MLELEIIDMNTLLGNRTCSFPIVKYVIATLLLGFSGSLLSAETVLTTDGRKIQLNQDGTYEYLDTARKNWSEFVSLREPKFKIAYESQNQRSIRFMPTFENIQPKTILGIKFTTTFQNSFGEAVFKFTSIHEDPLHYKQYTTTALSFAFQEIDNVSDEAFEKLLPLVELNSHKIKTEVLAISFSDGSILHF